MKKMNVKSIILVALIIVLCLLFIPIRNKLQDGGSVEYNAVLYKLTVYHQIDSIDDDNNVIKGRNDVEFKFFPFNYLS